jgi:hypothetical protein
MQIELPMQTRLAAFEPATINVEKRTAEVVWTTGASVRRMDFWTGQKYNEVLSLDPAHVRMDRLNSGAAPFLNSHDSMDLRNLLGVVERASVSPVARATVRFSDRPDVEGFFRDVQNGIIRNISVGYLIHKIEKTREADRKTETWRVIDWEPTELSAVPVGADPGAGFRSSLSPMSICNPVEIVERSEPSHDIEAVILPNYSLLRARLALANS